MPSTSTCGRSSDSLRSRSVAARPDRSALAYEVTSRVERLRRGPRGSDPRSAPIAGECKYRLITGEDAPSFESFFQGEYERLFRALCLILGDAHEAEEVAQEAFAIVWERWERVARMDSPAGYAFRVAINTSRRRFRRLLYARRHVQPPPTSDEFERVENQDEASRVLSRLPHQQRTALVLTSYLGYSSEEAAAVLGIKASTVRVLTSRARSTVRTNTSEQRHE